MNKQVTSERKTIGRTAAARAAMSLILALALMLMPVSAIKADAATFKDTTNHWASAYIEKAVARKFISGYSDGTFKPDASVTRAEFVTMINKALALEGTAAVSFSDVKSSQWYYDAVCKAVSAGYISGYSNGTFCPSNKVTRQEAAVMLGRIIPTYGYSADLSKFKDGSKVPSWAKTAVQKIVGKGYLGTYGDNMLHMSDTLTRAQAVKIIISFMDEETIVSANKAMQQAGVKLSNAIVCNRLSVGSSIGEGTVYLDNCVLLGTLNVLGGGTDSKGVFIQNTRVANCTVDKDEKSVSLHATGESTVLNLEVEQIADLQTSSISGEGQGYVKVDMVRGGDLYIEGSVGTVNMNGAKCDIYLNSGKIGTLNVPQKAYQSAITLEAGTVISLANVYANGTVFHGQGKVTKLNKQCDSVIFDNGAK